MLDIRKNIATLFKELHQKNLITFTKRQGT